jgi:type I restriction-modification system DNA methylase subunit
LIRDGNQVGANDYALYGQEMYGSTWALCKMNMFLHGVDAAGIEGEDTLRHPQFLDESGALLKFEVAIANPPCSLDKWGQEIAENAFNLNIPRYVDTFEPEPEIDIKAVQVEIDTIEKQLVQTRAKMKGYLKELGFIK